MPVALVSWLFRRHHAQANSVSAVEYGASNIVARTGSTSEQGDGTDVTVAPEFHVSSDQSLAEGIVIGKRIPSTKVLNVSDARPWHFHELLPSNGRWRVVIFTGDITKPEQRRKLEAAGSALAAKDSFLSRFTPLGAPFDDVFEVLAVHSAPRHEVTVFDFPEAFRHCDEIDGYDYSKIYVDDLSYHEGHGKLYETFAIAPQGCAVIIRPDQYVSYVGPMDDVGALTKFFYGFMVPAADGNQVPLTDRSKLNCVQSTTGAENKGALANASKTNGVQPGSQAVDLRVA